MSRLSKNIIFNLFGQGMLVLLSFVAAKFIFAKLGQDALGIIYFALMLNSLLVVFLEMGISSTMTREVSRFAREDPAYVKKLIQTSSFLYWCAYFTFALLLYGAAPFIAEHWISLSTMSVQTAVSVIRIAGVAALLALPQILYASIFRGIQRMEFNNGIDVIISIIQQMGIMILVLRGEGVIQVSYFIVASSVLGILFYLAALSRFFHWSWLIPQFVPAIIKRISGYASSMMLISVLGTVYRQIDKVLLSVFLPIGAFGYYSTAYLGLSKGGFFADSISQAAFPSFSALFQEQRREDLKIQYRRLQTLTCVVAAIIFSGILYAAFPIFTFVFTREIAQLLFLPLALLSVGFFMHETVKVPYFFSLAVGRPDITLKMNFAALFVVLPLNILLIYYFGFIGAGLAWIVYHIFIYGYAILRVCKECLQISPKEWYVQVLKTFAAAVGAYGSAGFFAWYVFHASLLPLAGMYLLATAAFLLIVYVYIDRKLIETTMAFVLHRMPRFTR